MNLDYIDAYKFNIYLKDYILEEWVYTEGEVTHEDDLKKIYFTKEKIEKLKQKLIKQIQESENPFEIYCNDTDTYDKELQMKYYGKLPEIFEIPKDYVKTKINEE